LLPASLREGDAWLLKFKAAFHFRIFRLFREKYVSPGGLFRILGIASAVYLDYPIFQA
jgi:hypothetical protein